MSLKQSKERKGLYNTFNDPKKNNITVSNAPEVEVLETANESLLNNIPRLRAFFKQAAEKIIQEEDIKYQQTPRDPQKEYPKLDIFGWSLVLDSLKYVLFENPYLYSNGEKSPSTGSYIYNYNKTVVLWDIYQYLCKVYGFIPCEDGFLMFTGLEMEQLKRWATTKGLDLLKKIRETEKVTFKMTFRDSKVPLERIYTANNLYNLNNEKTAADDAPELETLPDLLALPDGTKENCVNNSNNVLQ